MYSEPQVLEGSAGEEPCLCQPAPWWLQSRCPHLSLLAASCPARGALARPGAAEHCCLVRAPCRKTRLGEALGDRCSPPGAPTAAASR